MWLCDFHAYAQGIDDSKHLILVAWCNERADTTGYDLESSDLITLSINVLASLEKGGPKALADER